MATTVRYTGDTDPIKMSLADGGTVRADLADAEALAFLAVNTADDTDTITGDCTVIDETDGSATYNCEYALLSADTVAPGTFDLFVSVTESDGTTIATYAGDTLQIKAKT